MLAPDLWSRDLLSIVLCPPKYGALSATEHVFYAQSSDHGVKYVVEGLVQTPNGGALKCELSGSIDEVSDIGLMMDTEILHVREVARRAA